MVKILSRGGRALGLFAALTLLAGGCGPQATTDTKPTGTDVAKATGQNTGKGDGGKKEPHDHSGWWCDEHGIPEHECSMCSAKVAKELKAKGDWCDKHDRAKSQCFICDPSLKEKFAAKYRAKFGTEPPPVGEDEEKKEEGKKDEGKK